MWCKAPPSPRAPLAFYFVQSLTKAYCFVLGIHPMCVLLFWLIFNTWLFFPFVCVVWVFLSCSVFIMLFSEHQRWASVSLIDSPSFVRWIKEVVVLQWTAKEAFNCRCKNKQQQKSDSHKYIYFFKFSVVSARYKLAVVGYKVAIACY